MRQKFRPPPVLSLAGLCLSYNIVANELLGSIPQGYFKRKLVASFGHAAWGGWIHIDKWTDNGMRTGVCDGVFMRT